MRQVAVLFARSDSVYKTMPGCDVWDIERDARKWPGGAPVVAHPPCWAWGSYAHVAKPREGEKELALIAVELVRRWGGALEHPKKSRLFHEVLPRPGQRDVFGGWTLPIMQHWFGHRAEKATLLYICGVEPGDIPSMHFKLGGATHVIGQGRQARPDLDRGRLKKGMPGWRPEVTPREREATPPALGEWLVELARRTRVEEIHPKGDQPRFERGREGMEPEACESAAGRGADGAPALATLPQHESPVGGPMGVWQPAAAGPTCGQEVAAI